MIKHTKKILWITIILIIIVISYKIYAPTSISDFQAINLQNMKKIEQDLTYRKDNNYSFTVVGNIENSISIFDRNILKKIQQKNPDFILSTGNNVIDGGEGKYRILHKTLQKSNIPFLTGVGKSEVKDEGYKNFYKYFGPFYYTFEIKDSYFIFVDNTGHTSYKWQQKWLESQLKVAKNYQHRFIIMNKPPLKLKLDYLIKNNSKYITSEEKRKYYQNIFSEYQVDAVFSSNISLYHQENIKGVDYFITGGAGGELIVNEKNSFYHFLTVNIDNGEINYSVNKIDNQFSTINSNISKIITNVWVYFQSFIYTNYLILIIIALILFLICFLVYLELNKNFNYYRDFSYVKDDFKKDKKMKIAMFTNNYFPNIGGVPISIFRLTKGLQKLGHEVYIFAPQYNSKNKTGDENKENENVIRCKPLIQYQKNNLDMPIVNIFSPEIKRKFNNIDFDIVHIHHPFWLGSKGASLARQNDIPYVFTYHTRLEKYAHYLPDISIIKKLFKNRISHFLIKRFSNNSNAIFAPTNTAKEYLRNVGVSKHIEVVPTGIELNNYDYKPQKIKKLKDSHNLSDEIIFFSVSRLTKEKNLYFLMEGIKNLKENTDLNFKFLLAGDGPEKKNLLKYISNNNLEDYVKVLGLVDQKKISQYYMLADLFIYASKSETQGMVILEAMAGQTPVVAVRSSGIDDVIVNNYNGYKTEEDIQKWTEKIEKIAKDKKLLAKLSKNARTTAEENSITKMAEKSSKIYHKIFYFHK